MTNTKLVSLLVLAGTAILLTSTATSQSAASDVTVGSGENGSTTTAGAVTAQGGNVTSANITVSSITSKWSAFYGQLTAEERLSDASGNNFYKWTVTNPTASGSWIYAVPNSQGAPDSLAAVNSPDSFLGAGFQTGADKASETFNTTANLASTTSTAAANTFVQGAGASDTFTSGLANDTSTAGDAPVYIAEVRQDSTGFNGEANDFQLLVGVGESTSTKSYDFYAKIG